MNSVKTTPDNFGKELAEILSKYSEDVREKVNTAIDKTADELVENLKAASPDSGNDHRKKYAKGWKKEIAFESTTEKRVVVHNKTAYRLTHLLENGHAKSAGGRVAARIHIKPEEDKAETTLTERIEEAAK